MAEGPMKYLGLVDAFSLIEMWHAAYLCDKDPYCEGMIAYAVAAGAISAGLCSSGLLSWAGSASNS